MSRADELSQNWILLAETSIPNDGLQVREAEEIQINGNAVLFALDERQHRQLLIPIPMGQTVRDDKRSSGVQVASRQMLDRGVLRKFMTLICLKPHLDPLFSIIVGEILDRLQADGATPDLAAQQVLNRWRELLERPPADLPPREVIIGAFGELYTLRQLTQHESDSVRFWLGADRARHDFLAKSTALEVKTTTDRNRLSVTIRGHDQLEPPTNTLLYLILLQLERVGNGGDSLLELVDHIVDYGCDRSVLLTQLGKIDITPDVLLKLRDERYVVRQQHVYFVDDNFPKLTSKSFVSGTVPDRVSMITYQIDLSSQPPVPLSTDDVDTLYKTIAAEAST